MFDKESRPTFVTLVVELVESADSIPESADSAADSAANPLKIGLWVQAYFDYSHSRIVLPYLPKCKGDTERMILFIRILMWYHSGIYWLT